MDSIIETKTKPVSVSIYELENKLKGWKRRSNGFTALCPAHNDKNPSLSIKQMPDKILLHCFANCTTAEICAALGITPGQLFANAVKAAAQAGKHSADNCENYIFYDYKDQAGLLKYQCVRIESCKDNGEKSKTFRQRQPDGKGGWIWNITNPPVEKLLYRLPELSSSSQEVTVFITEGEKDADLLNKLGLTATCNSLGAGKWEDHYSQFLQNRRCVVIADNDKPGRDHALSVAKSLTATAAEVKILNLPGLAEKADVTDWINAGGTAEELLELAIAAPLFRETDYPEALKISDVAVTENFPLKVNSRQTISQKLLALTETAELFHTADNTAYATVQVGAIKENIPVKSEKFADWLNNQYFDVEENIAPLNSVREVQNVLSGRAKYKGKLESVYIRIAEREGIIYLDLGDSERRVAAVSGTGWMIINDPPVKFLRPDGMQALPLPERGGDATELRQFLNVTDDGFILILGWLVACFQSNHPHPALILQGEQGSSKSTAVRVIRQIFDPNMAPLRSAPSNERDLMIAAENNAVLCFDNISFIKAELSDSLCRILTGGGFATRKLFADRSETIISLIRPIIMNGIGDLIVRSDLLDRSIIVNFPPLLKRRPEAGFWKEFDNLHPRILGAFLDAAAEGLRNLELVTRKCEEDNTELPRLADFALWVMAAEDSFGLRKGEFMQCYIRNRKAAHDTVLDLDLIADLIVRFVEEKIKWSGLPAELLNSLKTFADDSLLRLRDFPKDPRSLGVKLARIAPNLRGRGIEYTAPDRTRRTENRTIGLKILDTSLNPICPEKSYPEEFGKR